MNKLCYILMMLWVISLSSCVNEALCEIDGHPHSAKVNLYYEWNDGKPAAQRPDSIINVFYRVIDTWRCGYIINPKQNEGRYFVNSPATWQHTYKYKSDEQVMEEIANGDSPSADNSGVDGTVVPKNDDEQFGQLDDKYIADPETGDIATPMEPEEPEEPELPGVEDESEMEAIINRHPDSLYSTNQVALRSGTYKTLAFSFDTIQYEDGLIRQYLSDPTSVGKFQELDLEYKAYPKSSKQLRRPIPNWVDYNPYSRYIQPDMAAVYYDSIEATYIDHTKETDFRLSLSPITTHITFKINIEKDPESAAFAIDSVYAEVSGVPSAINISTGRLNIVKTYKMMFPTQLQTLDGQPIEVDSYENGWVRSFSEIDVPSLVGGRDELVSTGPGIMQLVMYLHAPDTIYSTTVDGEAIAKPIIRKKVLQGKVNLLHKLEEAQLYTVTADHKAVERRVTNAEIEINGLKISGDHILENPSAADALKWEESGFILVDV